MTTEFNSTYIWTYPKLCPYQNMGRSCIFMTTSGHCGSSEKCLTIRNPVHNYSYCTDAVL